MVPDFQTSMRVIRESNQSFLDLIMQLRSFLTADTEITVTVGGEPVTLPSLPAVIRAYRGGAFDSITLKSGSDVLTLSTEDGALKVSGPNGLASIEVDKVVSSQVVSSTAQSVNATSCTIDALNASAALNVGTISVQDLILNALTVSYLSLQSLSTRSLEATTLTVDKITMGQMYISPGNVKDLFCVPGGSPYNYAASNYVFADASIGSTKYKFWKCVGLSGAAKDPTTYGFYAKPANNVPMLAPDAKYLQGDYAANSTEVDNIGIAALGAYGNRNITYTNVKFLNTPFDVVQSWPVALYGEGPTAAGYGMGFLQEIAPADEGKVMYFRTGGKSWRIARVLSLTYPSTSAAEPSTGSLGSYFEVPPYTSLRLRLSRSTSTAASGTVEVTNRLELV